MRLGVAAPFERSSHRDVEALGEWPGEEFGLIETSPEAAPPVQRHGYDQVEALIEGDGAEKKSAERVAESFDAGIFKQVNEIFERAVVVAVGVGAIEAGEAGAAAATDTVIVQGRFIQERGTALGAEIVCRQRGRRGEAGLADGNPAGVSNGLAANLAVLREDKIKQRREDSLSYGREERSVGIGYGPFREDPPPKPAVYNIGESICYDPGTYAEPPPVCCFPCRFDDRRAGASGKCDSALLR